MYSINLNIVVNQVVRSDLEAFVVCFVSVLHSAYMYTYCAAVLDLRFSSLLFLKIIRFHSDGLLNIFVYVFHDLIGMFAVTRVAPFCNFIAFFCVLAVCAANCMSCTVGQYKCDPTGCATSTTYNVAAEHVTDWWCFRKLIH